MILGALDRENPYRGPKRAILDRGYLFPIKQTLWTGGYRGLEEIWRIGFVGISISRMNGALA